jgi:uncharacterized protein involved in exopolysaccharide biosynthesis
MEIISILRVLRRHRFLVALGVVLSVLVALKMSYQVSFMPPSLASKQQTSGVATAKVVIAGRTQTAFDIDSEITSTLATRAAILADLLSADDVRARIARGAGLQPDELAVLSPVWGPPTVDIALPTAATEAARLTHEPYVLGVTSAGNVPIISFKATGPDPVRAAKITNAGIAAVGELIAARSRGRSNIVVERLGPALGRTLVTGPKKAIAIVATLVVFAVWCTAIVFLSWFKSRWRRRRLMSPVPQHSPST